MELRVCPSCRQSVLDDDVALCPFCGAAMDGSSGPAQPVSKPAAKPAAKPASADAGEKKPAAGGPGKTATPAKAAPAAKEQDPFAMKSQANKKAIPLQRKPTAKISHRVVCPMCDTNGFGTVEVAGKEVKCPNPKCLMPVFVAPEIPKEAPPAPKKPLLTPVTIGVAVLALAAAGGGAYVALQPVPTPAGPALLPPVQMSGETETSETVATTSTEPVPEKIAIPVLQAQILSSGVDSARQRSDNRSKEFCRVLTSSAYAVRNQIEDARGQLTAFDNFNSGLDFMKIAPLCQIAWQQLKQGDRTSAGQTADLALACTSKLPRTGADAVQQAVALGTLLIALERYDAARELVETRETLQDVAQSAARISMVIQDRTFDLAQSYRWLPRVELASPLAFAVTYGATVQGYGPQVQQWIEQIQNPERKADALAAYAAGLAFHSSSTGAAFNPATVLETAGVSDFDRQRAIALALQVLQLQQPASVPALLEQTLTAVNAWEMPATVRVPEFKEIYEGKYVIPPASLQVAIQTHLLLARLLSERGEADAAWQHAHSALQWSKGTAPALASIKPAADRVDQNRNQIETDLTALLNLQRADQKRNAFNQYRKNLRDIEEQAQKRYSREALLLELMLDWKLAPALTAAYQQQLTQAGEESNLTPLVEQKLLPSLLFSLNEAGDTASVSLLSGKAASLAGVKAPREIVKQMRTALQAGQIPQVLQAHASLPEDGKSPLLLLELSCELAQQAAPAVIVEWVNTIPDAVVQELAFRLTAAQLTQRGLIREHWEASQKRNLSATDKCSLNLGLMEGLSTTSVYDEKPTEAE